MTDGLETVRFNNFHEDTVLRYTNGECGALAEAISRRTGWPISLLEIGDEPRAAEHAVVRAPDGRYLDIQGLWTARDLLNHWSPHDDSARLRGVGEYEWDEEWSTWHERSDVTEAGPFARRVVARAEQELSLPSVV